MIIVKISGGLGNQLFQYSFGRFLSIKFNCELKFDIQTNYHYTNFTRRSFGLTHFNCDLKQASACEIHKFKCYDNNLLSRLERKIVQKLPFINRKYFVQNLYDFQKYIPSYRDNCYYDGYWQSENYFKSIEDIIRKDLDFNFTFRLSFNNKRILDDIKLNESVGVHIRRTDYITVKPNSLLFTPCSKEYYRRAIDFFTDKLSIPIFYFFSDDIDWAKVNFKDNRFRFIESNLDCPEVDLFLMSQCKNNIIANSSFSWWGAWLNSNPDKIVISPEKWYNGSLNKNSVDIIPSKWIKIY